VLSAVQVVLKSRRLLRTVCSPSRPQYHQLVGVALSQAALSALDIRDPVVWDRLAPRSQVNAVVRHKHFFTLRFHLARRSSSTTD
jgi:hypothetical protein